MRRCTICVLAVLVLGASGCSIAGRWEAVSVKPDMAMDKFPLQMVTFDNEGMYSSTCTMEGSTETSTGQYTWNGMKLEITPKDGTTRTYNGYQRLDGKLVLSRKGEDGKMTAVLEKQKEEMTE
jgi:hypothetical protein